MSSAETLGTRDDLENARARERRLEDDPSVRFIVATYGRRRLGMLLNHLHSILQTHPGASATVFWQDLPAAQLEAIRAAFPQFEFVETHFDFATDPCVRVASKVLVWSQAADGAARDERLCFADADTLVLRGIGHFFDEIDADVIFTHNPDRQNNRDRAPLNSGVMLARGGPAATALFQAWKADTLHILETPELFEQANDHSLPYAAADQMALHRILGYREDQIRYEILAGGQPVRVAAAPCQQLNEMNSRPLAEDIHIIHYKGGWQPILLDGRPFSRFRPWHLSWEMFVLYLNSFFEALAYLNAAAGTRFRPPDFGIVVPWHFHPQGRFNPVLYQLWRLHSLVAQTRSMVSRQLARIS